MDITFLCYWGLLCLVSGLLELVGTIDGAAHGQPLFVRGAPLRQQLGSVTMLLVPLVTLGGAAVAWSLYKDHTGAALEEDRAAHAPFSRPGSTKRSTFTTFAGSGQ